MTTYKLLKLAMFYCQGSTAFPVRAEEYVTRAAIRQGNRLHPVSVENFEAAIKLLAETEQPRYLPPGTRMTEYSRLSEAAQKALDTAA